MTENREEFKSNEMLNRLLDGELRTSLQLNQFLHKNNMGEDLQELVQCYVHDLIDWLRLNVDMELTSAVDDPLILLRNHALDDIEKVLEGSASEVLVAA